MPPRTIKRRMTTNLKTKKNQNCQKIELYGSLTTKELKKKHSSRLVRGAETGSQGGEDLRQGGSPTFACGHTRRNNWRMRQTAQPRVPAQGNKASKSLTLKTCGGCGGRRTSKPHRRVHWRDPQGHRMYTNPPTHPPTQESAPEGPKLLVGSGGSD